MNQLAMGCVATVTTVGTGEDARPRFFIISLKAFVL